MIARDAAIAGYEDGRIHVQHLSAARVGRGDRRRQGGGRAHHRRGTPHHLTLTDEALLESRSTRT